MILYDEFGQLLGADANSIKLFGCNDINEFKEKVRDISDFFVNKDGYIHKFDHYNWIDFLNYSEENIDKVLIKQKENNVVEAQVIIKEIYNLIKINNSKTTYMVDFIEQTILPFENEPLIEVRENDKEDKENNILNNKIELNYDKIKNEYDIDKEFYHELLNDFISESRSDLNLMSTYTKNNDYKALLKMIYRLKSICTNLHLSDFLSILDNIEKKVINKNYDNIKHSFDDYEKMINILIENIR